MAASLGISVSTVSQSIENNTSTINVRITLYTDSSTYNQTSSYKSTSVTIDGTNYSYGYNVNIAKNSSQLIYNQNITVTHATDGSKSVYIYAYGAPVTSSTTSSAASTTVILATIPRATKISFSPTIIGYSTTINLTRYTDTFHSTITYSFTGDGGTRTGTIATNVNADTLAWTIPDAWVDLVTTSTSGSLTLYCDTYNSSETQIGSTQSYTSDVQVNEDDVLPSLSYTATLTDDTATYTGSSNIWIANYSDVTVIASATAQRSATMSSYIVFLGDTYISTSTATFNNISSGYVGAIATDSRGVSATGSTTKTLIAYVTPTISFSSTPQVDASGNGSVAVNGVSFVGSFGVVTNTRTVQFRWKEDGGTYSSWINCTITAGSGNTYTATGSTSGIDYTKTIIFQAQIVDSLNTIQTAEIRTKSTPVFDWGEDDFNFNVDVNVEKDLTVGGDTTITGSLSSGSLSTTSGAIGTLTLTNDLAISHGGTGASTAADARINLEATPWFNSSNAIFSKSQSGTWNYTYTATEDCVCVWSGGAQASSSFYIKFYVNSVEVINLSGFGSMNPQFYFIPFYIKKGDTCGISVLNNYGNILKVYGVK